MPLYVRKSHFRLPKQPAKPVIMIGPGTGLAPFRGFLQERAAARARLGADAVGETVLYFGCRNRAHDYIYEDELTAYEKDGTITQLHTAFSRDQPEKVYVTHLLRQNRDDVSGEGGGGWFMYAVV